jgi:Flp pilus assembly protein TadD
MLAVYKKLHRKNLDYPDIFCVMAAEGWVELGNPVEAAAELDKISHQFQSHPDVLHVRWAICAREEKWDASLKIATTLVKKARKRSRSWLQYSISLYRLKRTEKAYMNLLQVVRKFPNEWIIRYELACFCAQLGKVEEAWSWLDEACQVGVAKAVKRLAVTDPDLEPLWKKEPGK